MNRTYRKTLLAGAVAALLATPIIAAGEVTRDGAQGPDVPQTGQQWRGDETTGGTATREWSDQPDSRGDTTTGGTATREWSDRPESSAQPQPKGKEMDEPGLSQLREPVGYPTEEGTKVGTSPRTADQATGAQVRDNPLYSRSFEDLDGQEVVDSTGKRIGKLKGVVLSPDRDSAHAVISSGGFLGMGTRETLVSFSELTSMDGRLQMNTSEEEFKARSEFESDDHINLDGDRPIRESIVEASPRETGYGSDQRRDTPPRGTGESEGRAITPGRTTESR